MSRIDSPRGKASRPIKLLILLLCLLVIGLIVGTAIVSQFLSGLSLFDEDPGGWLIGLAFGLIGVVGGLAALGQPRNAVGWILLASGVSIGLAGFGAVMAVYLRELKLQPEFALIADWLAGLGWYAGLLLIVVVFPFMFPTGRLPSGRIWRPVFMIASLYTTIVLGLMSIGGLALILAGATPDEMSQALTTIEATFLIVLPLLGFGIASLVVRYRQAQSDTRRQMKWLLLALGTPFILLLLLSVLEEMVAAPFSNFIYGLIYMLIPFGLGIALLRYKMFDVDTIIRRGTAYVILSVLLVLLYFGIVTFLQSLSSAVFGLQSPILIVISTLAIAALFNPLRRRVQDFIDRRFYRKKYNAEQALARFAAAARDETDIEELCNELVAVVQETMHPEQVSIWLKPAVRRRK